MPTSSPAENSSGRAKKLRENTSRARCRALSGNRNRSRKAAALSPSWSENVRGKSTSSSSQTDVVSISARSAARKLGLWATKAAMLSGGVRGILAKESRRPLAATSG